MEKATSLSPPQKTAINLKMGRCGGCRCESRFPGLVLAWDIFNEPEWGMASCPERSHTPNQGLWLDWVSNKGIQTFVAKCAVGIHEAGSMATLGSASMRYNWEKVDPSSTPPG